MRCIQLSIAINERDSALGNTGVAVHDEADIGSTAAEALGPGGVDGGDTEADHLEVLLLVGAGGKSLELGHTVCRRIDVNSSSSCSIGGDTSGGIDISGGALCCD